MRKLTVILALAAIPLLCGCERAKLSGEMCYTDEAGNHVCIGQPTTVPAVVSAPVAPVATVPVAVAQAAPAMIMPAAKSYSDPLGRPIEK